MNPTDNNFVRGKLTKTDDSGKQQTVRLTARHDEQYGGEKHLISHAQSYPLSVHMPIGSLGYIININGSPDMPTMLGGEHPDYRPVGLSEGEWKLYSIFNDKFDEIFEQESRITIKHKTEILFQVGDNTKIKITDGLVEITGADLKVSGEIHAKSDGINIKLSTHRHSGVQTGAGQTASPVSGT